MSTRSSELCSHPTGPSKQPTCHSNMTFGFKGSKVRMLYCLCFPCCIISSDGHVCGGSGREAEMAQGQSLASGGPLSTDSKWISWHRPYVTQSELWACLKKLYWLYIKHSTTLFKWYSLTIMLRHYLARMSAVWENMYSLRSATQINVTFKMCSNRVKILLVKNIIQYDKINVINLKK